MIDITERERGGNDAPIARASLKQEAGPSSAGILRAARRCLTAAARKLVRADSNGPISSRAYGRRNDRSDRGMRTPRVGLPGNKAVLRKL